MPISNLEFIFMGTGTSAGVPIIACDCRVCTSTDPRDRRTRCGAAIRFRDAQGEQRVILIDTTPDLREQVLRHGLMRCDAIIYTHNHVDHIFGLDDVRRFNAVMNAPIDIHADGHTLETLGRVYRHIFDSVNNINPSFVATLIPHEIEPFRSLELFGLRFLPLPLLHGRLPVLGFRIEEIEHRFNPSSRHEGTSRSAGSSAHRSDNDTLLPLAYCTDVSSIPPETWPHLEGVRTLILDMLRYRHHPTHLTVDQSLEIAERIGADRTCFTHMTHDIMHADLDPKLPEGMSLAYDGLVLRDGAARHPGNDQSPGE